MREAYGFSKPGPRKKQYPDSRVIGASFRRWASHHNGDRQTIATRL
jgi:hypothetical protein